MSIITSSKCCVLFIIVVWVELFLSSYLLYITVFVLLSIYLTFTHFWHFCQCVGLSVSIPTESSSVSVSECPCVCYVLWSQWTRSVWNLGYKWLYLWIEGTLLSDIGVVRCLRIYHGVHMSSFLFPSRRSITNVTSLGPIERFF